MRDTTAFWRSDLSTADGDPLTATFQIGSQAENASS
jgi:hypothetical protein